MNVLGVWRPSTSRSRASNLGLLVLDCPKEPDLSMDAVSGMANVCTLQNYCDSVGEMLAVPHTTTRCDWLVELVWKVSKPFSPHANHHKLQINSLHRFWLLGAILMHMANMGFVLHTDNNTYLYKVGDRKKEKLSATRPVTDLANRDIVRD